MNPAHLLNPRGFAKEKAKNASSKVPKHYGMCLACFLFHSDTPFPQRPITDTRTRTHIRAHIYTYLHIPTPSYPYNPFTRHFMCFVSTHAYWVATLLHPFSSAIFQNHPHLTQSNLPSSSPPIHHSIFCPPPRHTITGTRPLHPA